MSKIRIFFIAFAALAVLAPATAVAEASAKPASVVARAAQQCADADLEPAAGNLGGSAPRSSACTTRSARARPSALRESPRLRRAATGHSEDMVTRRFFEHTAPRGVTMVDRIMRTNYARQTRAGPSARTSPGAPGASPRPRGVMQAWMESPGHRANVLSRAYRELGIGVVTGVPSGSAGRHVHGGLRSRR